MSQTSNNSKLPPGTRRHYSRMGGVISTRLTLTEAVGADGKPTGKVVAQGLFARANEETGNGRVYPLKILEREAKKLIEKIERLGGVLGELDHPADGTTRASRAAHAIKAVVFDPSTGAVTGTMELLDTEAGRAVKAIVEAGVSLGVSSRGKGSVIVNESGQEVVQEDYDLDTFDLVGTPANTQAFPTWSITEELDTNKRREAEMAEDPKKVTSLDDLKIQFPELVKQLTEAAQAAAAAEFAKKGAEARDEEIAKVLTEAKSALLAKEKELVACSAARTAQQKQIAEMTEQLNEAVGVAKELGYRLYTERTLLTQPPPVRKLAERFLGDLRRISSAEALKVKLAESLNEARRVLEHSGVDKAKLSRTMTQIEAEVRKLETDNLSLKTQNTKLTEGLEKSLGTALQLGVRAYVEQKISDHPRRHELRKLVEVKAPQTRAEADRLLEELLKERRTSDEFNRLRSRMGRGHGPTPEAETAGSAKKTIDGQDVTEMRRLSGLA